MRAFILGMAAVAGLSAPVLAGEDIMANYFGNTVVASNQLGEVRVHYKPDHSFSGRADGPAGKYDIRGTWKIDAQNNLCRSYDTFGHDLPPGTPNPWCTPWEAHKVGDVWTMTQGGKSAEVRLISGR